MRKYETFDDLTGLIHYGMQKSNKTAEQFGNSSLLIRDIIESSSPGLSYAVLTQISHEVIIDGRTGKAKQSGKPNNLESWLGQPNNLQNQSKLLDKREIAFIEAKFNEIKNMKLAHSQGPQACWLANYACKTDLGKIFADPRAAALPLYYKIEWNKLPSWH